MIAILASVALGQTEGCAWTVGTTASTQRATRDWDLSTSAGSSGIRTSFGATCRMRATWVGVDFTPGLRHAYRSLDGRAPLAGTMEAGVRLVGDEDLALASWMQWNGSAVGYGAVVFVPLKGRDLQLRAGVVPGRTTTWLAGVRVDTLKARAPNDAEGPLRMGFELGSMPALRAVAEVDEHVHLGLRAGVFHRAKRGLFFRPTLLGTVAIVDEEGFGIQASAGAMWRGEEALPTAGVATTMGNRWGFQVGVLALLEDARPRVFMDTGVVLRW